MTVDSRIDLVWFTMCGIVTLFVLLKTDRAIRILSYGRRRLSDIPARQVAFLRITAAICLVGCLVWVAQNLWSTLCFCQFFTRLGAIAHGQSASPLGAPEGLSQCFLRTTLRSMRRGCCFP